MIPRRYARETKDVFNGWTHSVDFTLGEKDENNKSQGVTITVTPGYYQMPTRVPQPGTSVYKDIYPEDESGNPVLFKEHPSVVSGLYKSLNATPHAVEQALALAHQEATQHGPGTLTYDDDLTAHSAKIALHALKKGYVVENPLFPRTELEDFVQLAKDTNRGTTEARIRESTGWNGADNIANQVESTFDNLDEHGGNIHYTGPSYDLHGIVETSRKELPSTAGSDAVKSARINIAVRKRRDERLQETEEEQPQAPKPTVNDPTLFDFLPRKERNNWYESIGRPKQTRVDIFKQSIGSLVSKVKGLS